METESLSVIGLTIQCAGICLITILSFFMTRSIQRRFLDYWTAAWVCLSVALFSLAVGFRAPSMHRLYYSVYFLGEYAFGYLFAWGCRNYASGERLKRRHLSRLIPAAALAVTLSQISDDFNIPFI